MRRVRITFWGLVVIAIVSTGVLMRAVASRADPVTGLTVATSGVMTVVAVAFAVRILVVTDRMR